jgi:cytidine deaminase
MIAKPWLAAAVLRADPQLSELVEQAVEVRHRAWAPYSGFRVGAALRGESGRVYLGVNVENASYGVAICAERTAIVSAVAEGERRFSAIAIVTDADTPAAPCGICRQMLAEFALAEPDQDLPVTLVSLNGSVAQLQLSALLPLAFTPRSFRVRPSEI